MINCMNSSNADLKTFTSNVDLLQKDSDAKSKCLCNDKKNVVNIINLLIQISTFFLDSYLIQHSLWVYARFYIL